jgi:hypothetical protein
MKNEVWKKVGEVGVDTASLVLMDPCNCYDLDESLSRGLGTVVQTGMGDGVYDVLVREVKDSMGYVRIAEVRVVFISPPP